MTARTPPPAITPVPADAGFIITFAAPNRARIGWAIVVLFIGTRIRFLRAIDDALADRLRHLVRLAHAGADVPLPVADDDDRAEAEAPAALHHLRDAVDEDDLLLQLEVTRLDASRPGSGVVLGIVVVSS